ncbi:MAG: hypothetical protein ACKOET_18100, partial [Verrucomicrobiota bacterium]
MRPTPPTLTGSRRDFLARLGGGFGSVALAQLLAAEAPPVRAPRPATGPGRPFPAPRPARARRVIQLFM